MSVTRCERGSRVIAGIGLGEREGQVGAGLSRHVVGWNPREGLAENPVGEQAASRLPKRGTRKGPRGFVDWRTVGNLR
jgi:hypothetical protein